jgi:transposase
VTRSSVNLRARWIERALDGLSREELLELLVRHVEVVGQQQEALAERDAAIERRDEKIRELEDELAQCRRPVKTPENSSVPPSRGQQAQRVERRKAGPKRGQVGISRLRREPDVVVECRPGACGGCGGPGPVSWRTAPRRSCA